MKQKVFINIVLVILVVILAGAMGYFILNKELQVQVLETQPEASSVTDINQKIDERILKLAGEENPNSIVEVIVLLMEDQKIQVLPEDPVERKQAVEQLSQARKISQASLIRRLQPYGVIVIEQYWLTNGFLAKTPLKTIEVIASQPEVISVQPRYGGEPPP